MYQFRVDFFFDTFCKKVESVQSIYQKFFIDQTEDDLTESIVTLKYACMLGMSQGLSREPQVGRLSFHYLFSC